jgi:hypothetical protein
MHKDSLLPRQPHVIKGIRGLRPCSGALSFDPRSGASPTLGGFAFRPTLGGFAFRPTLGGLRPRSGALPFDPRSRVSLTLEVLAQARGLRPRPGFSPTLGGCALSTYARGLRPTLGGCALSTYARGLRPPDLRSGASLFRPRQTRHTYTIYTQSGGTDAATWLVHGAAAPWFAL